jgi:SAM-dependent methyltransferase
MNTERINELKRQWLEEEKVAHIKGWDFSHIADRYNEEDDLPWDYKGLIEQYLEPDMKLLDFDTGGGEFLLSLGHPYKNTAATEGFPPNVELCSKTLLPLGIDFKACDDASNIPFADKTFDMFINRHGDFDPVEAARVLKDNGIFITQQVGAHNDRDLVLRVLPDTPEPFPTLTREIQEKRFEDAGFEILQAGEIHNPIEFYDVGAFVWFARIIEWEFPGFSVEKCFDKLLELQKEIDEKGKFVGTIHRFMILARKK